MSGERAPEEKTSGEEGTKEKLNGERCSISPAIITRTKSFDDAVGDQLAKGYAQVHTCCRDAPKDNWSNLCRVSWNL